MGFNKTLQTAHAGCMNTPMDSLEAVKVALEYDVDIIEVDVRFTENLTPVLSHNVIKKQNDSEYVTLEEVVKLVSENEKVCINLDMKEYHGFRGIDDIVKKYNMGHRVFFTGIEFENVEKVNKSETEIPYFINYDFELSKITDKEYLSEIRDRVCKANALGINLDYNFVSKELIDVFHEVNKLVSVWTVDDYNKIKLFSHMGVDSITSRNIANKINM